MYLTHDEIEPKSIIVIEFETGESVPYFVNQKHKGNVSGATMLLGHTLLDLIKNPNLYPCSTTGGADRYYIANEERAGHHEGVAGYRRFNDEEKDEWVKKIKLIDSLSPLLEF